MSEKPVEEVYEDVVQEHEPDFKRKVGKEVLQEVLNPRIQEITEPKSWTYRYRSSMYPIRHSTGTKERRIWEKDFERNEISLIRDWKEKQLGLALKEVLIEDNGHQGHATAERTAGTLHLEYPDSNREGSFDYELNELDIFNWREYHDSQRNPDIKLSHEDMEGLMDDLGIGYEVETLQDRMAEGTYKLE